MFGEPPILVQIISPMKILSWPILHIDTQKEGREPGPKYVRKRVGRRIYPHFHSKVDGPIPLLHKFMETIEIKVESLLPKVKKTLFDPFSFENPNIRKLKLYYSQLTT